MLKINYPNYGLSIQNTGKLQKSKERCPLKSGTVIYSILWIIGNGTQ